jgi:hypothetical protein
VTALDVLLVAWGFAAFLVGMLCSHAPEEVEPPCCEGRRRLDANEPTINQEHAA